MNTVTKYRSETTLYACWDCPATLCLACYWWHQPNCPKTGTIVRTEPGESCDRCGKGNMTLETTELEAIERRPTIIVSMSRKLNLGDYESADAFVSLSGITAGMTEEEMRPLMDTGKIAWDVLRVALADKVREMRADNDRAKGFG